MRYLKGIKLYFFLSMEWDPKNVYIAYLKKKVSYVSGIL